LLSSIETIKPRSDITHVALIGCQPYHKGHIHVDLEPHPYAVNFPITGCKDSYTCFYKLTTYNCNSKEILSNPWSPTFRIYADEEVEEVDRFYLHKAAIFNTQVPHRVINNTGQPRIILSVRFGTPLDIDKLNDS